MKAPKEEIDDTLIIIDICFISKKDKENILDKKHEFHRFKRRGNHAIFGV